MPDLITHYEGLTNSHLAELNTLSAISAERIRARYYQSVTADQLPPQFADYQRRDGLLIPIHTVRGRIESFQLKPNEPRLTKDGKPIKYETAANAPQVLDVPASVRPHLADPKMPLVITEGAKKVDSALSAGLKCTIGLQGVYGWRGRNEHGGKAALPDWEQIALNGREVMLAFDSDVMTRASVRDALDRLSAFLRGKGAKVCYLVLPPLSDGAKCGLDDWFARGKRTAALGDYIVAKLPPLEGAASSTPVAPPRLAFRYMRDVQEREIDWIWNGWLPKGMLTLLGGYAGDGKSTLTTALAAALSIGGTLPDGTAAPLVKTLMVTTEDDVETVVKPRLAVHGMNPDNIITLDGVPLPEGGERAFNIRTDLPLLRQVVVEEGIRLVVIDPLSGVLASGDRNSEGEVRDALTPLIKMGEDTGCAVLGIMHIGKNDGQAKAHQKLMGSTAFTALARSVWMVHELPAEFQADGDPVRKLVEVTKSNYAVAPKALQFWRPLDAALEWLGESPIGFSEAAAWRKKVEKEDATPTETDKAEEWLLEFMDGRRVLASAVEAAAKEEGIGMSAIKRAKLKLGVSSKKENQQWFWYPAAESQARTA